jgi:hypothetical protein
MNKAIDCRKVVDCKSFRRFGIEIEVNPLTGIVRRPDCSLLQIPVGSDYVANIIQEVCKEQVEIMGWDYIHNNSNWVVKPDNSCGIEINTPVLKGWLDLKKLLRVIDALANCGVCSDDRCSLHVHVNISDLNTDQLLSVIAWYIKCEHIFIDSVPLNRKNNRYCQPIGLTDIVSHDSKIGEDLICKVSSSKYYSLNAYHFLKGGGFSIDNSRKKTVEFRLAEGAGCLDAWYAKNWIRLLLHFVETTKDINIAKYNKNNPKSGLAWIDLYDMFKLLKFDQPLSPGMLQVKNWFLERIVNNGYNNDILGIWSNEGRKLIHQQALELIDKNDVKTSRKERIYSDDYIL